ncbi:MAG: ABC-F family ATP-binding cassette domain-containing protein, partial [Deltaproteobacteria bacterium]|nr:ABC-F family ATP-binding cassette domain-containing protein [Deltaproteobacteria bacterium]
MLKVNGLCKQYGPQVLFEDVSFSLTPGEKIGLVGRNGHGKSTLFKIILGQEEPDSGEVSVPKYYRTGHLSQRLDFTQPTVIKEACMGLPHNEDGIDETYKAEAILMGLGIGEELFDSSPLSLSGGYQVRLNLAKVLVSGPDLLLLDEPTNYLDIVSARWLERFLRDWKGELIMITHDRGFMDAVTTHTMGIHRSKVRKVQGPTTKLYEQILTEEETYEQTRQNEEKKRAEVEKFIARFRASATKASAVQSRVKALEKKGKLEELRDVKSLDFAFNEAQFQSKYLLEARDLSFGYGGDSPLLIKDLSFTVSKGDRIGVIGKNGRGKTTLLNLLNGEMKPLSGDVNINQNTKMAFFGQTNIDRLTRANTVEQELMYSQPDCTRGTARRICGAMMFEGDSALKKIEVLSGGERARVLLGKLLISPANMLLLDEPTNHLDMDSIDSLIEAIDAFGGAAIMVTHSELMLDALATRLIIFDGGSVSLFEGGYREFLEKIGWESEATEDKSARKPKAAKGINKKELRKLRADLSAEKTRVIGPLQKRIAATEGAIVEAEKKAEAENMALLAASERAEADAISAHSKAYHDAMGKMDSLFDELEKLSAELASKTAEFE